MDSTHGIHVVLRNMKAGVLYIALVLLLLGTTATLTSVIGALDPLYKLGIWIFALGSLLLVMRRHRSAPFPTKPRTAFGRFFSEFRRVWSPNYMFLGLVTMPL